jgi:mRNA-degrading endonuclease toxin of MazEF toxin-antitoxin module
MAKECSIAARGQVFYYNPIWGIYGKGKEPKNTYQNNGSLEFKTRPYLVISTNKGNFSSTTCNVIPITTRDETAIPSQVKFVFNGRNQVILTEQITTCNLKDLGDYCYTVSDEILSKVQKGLCIQFDMTLRTPEITMEELAMKLEAVVDKVLESAKRKAQAVTVPQDTIDSLALKFGSVVEDLMEIPEKTVVLPNSVEEMSEKENSECNSSTLVVRENVVESKPEIKPEIKPENRQKRETPNYSGMSAIEKFNARYNRTEATQNSSKPKEPVKAAETKVEKPTKTTEKKPRKQPWDIEKQKQFLADCEKLTPDELMVKYGFQTKKDVYSHKYLIKNRIKNSDN